MPIADIAIAAAIAISIVVGVFRGFVREAISIAALLIAIWAAMNFGAPVGGWLDMWITSDGAQLWTGRILVFIVILAAGGLLGWAVSRLVRLSILNGLDRGLGAGFGFCRGVLLLGVFVIGGQLAGFDHDGWWQRSKLLPAGTVVADWIRVMAPQGINLLQPESTVQTGATFH